MFVFFPLDNIEKKQPEKTANFFQKKPEKTPNSIASKILS